MNLQCYHKFLGVLVDHKLLWREQTEYALDKGLKWLAVFRRLAKVKTGIPMRISQRLYLAVAIPRMLYAADVFLTPQHKVEGATRRKGSVTPTPCFLQQSSTRYATMRQYEWQPFLPPTPYTPTSTPHNDTSSVTDHSYMNSSIFTISTRIMSKRLHQPASHTRGTPNA